MIYLFYCLFLQLNQKQYDNVQAEKQKVEQALLEALENTGEKYEEVINAPEDQKKNTLERVFLKSFYVAMGLFGQEEKQEYLRMYLPMLVLVEEDGAFFFYMQEKKNGDITELCHVWSEKNFFLYEEDSTEEQKKSVIVEVLEKKASDIITHHNYIASQYGIAYSFSAPSFLQDPLQTLEFPMIFAVFQGWPLDVTENITYENCLDAGVYLQEVKCYAVTGPENISDTKCRYHVPTCTFLVEHPSLILAEYIEEGGAVFEFGAFPCEICIPSKE